MNKKEIILQVALELFSKYGFENTPTVRIAKQAGVSEALIFRHFEHKEGLLKAIAESSIRKIQPFFDSLLHEVRDVGLILKVIELPYQIIKAEKNFWQLQLNLKTQNSRFKQYFDISDYLTPIQLRLHQAFTRLQYLEPDLETQYFLTLLNGLTFALIAFDNLDDGLPMIQYIQSKYKS